MKITYTPNPLRTIVELDEHEIEVLRLKLKLEQYEDMMFGAHWDLTRDEKYLAGLPKPKTVEQSRQEAIDALDPKHWCTDEPSKVDKRVEELLQHYLEELRGSHLGDCTAFPMSCSKCHAESVLGIDTLKPYPGKSVLYALESNFWERLDEKDAEGRHKFRERSVDEVLDRLKDNKAAHEWLTAYTARRTAAIS